jgi:hypothetical protein
MKQLISTLVERQALTKDNVITASYTVRDGLGRSMTRVGDFGIIDLATNDENFSFTLQHVTEKNHIRINDDMIIAIDGMDPTRYAEVYDINADGSSKKMGKKRGRKPKIK